MAVERRLSFERQREILGRLGVLADGIFAYSAELKARGFKSLSAVEEFERSFIEPEEVELHKICVIDRARRRISSPNGSTIKKGEPLDWMEVDPYIKRFKQIARDNPTFLNQVRQVFEETFFNYRAEELKSFPQMTSEVINAQIASTGYAAFFGFMLSDAFIDQGFVLDTFRSRPNFPVISKPLTKNWDICWSPESDRELLWKPRQQYREFKKLRTLDLQCYVRSKSSGGFTKCPIVFQSINFMMIRVESLFDGAIKAYSLYDGVEESGLVLSAHANLYQMVSGTLEELLSAELD